GIRDKLVTGVQTCALPIYALATREIVYWTDLRGQTVILSEYDPGREIEDLLVSKLVSPEDRPKIERHDISRGVVKSFVTMNFGKIGRASCREREKVQDGAV